MIHMVCVSAMLHIGTLNARAIWPELRPVWLWRVFVRDAPEREVVGIAATRQWGAITAGAQALGVGFDEVEAEVIPSRV